MSAGPSDTETLPVASAPGGAQDTVPCRTARSPVSARFRKAEITSVPTTCPFCGCGCGVFLLARDGELVGAAPSRSHPIAGGKLCARGWNAHQAPLWGERATQPMIRRGERLEAVSWDAALEHVTARLQGLRQAGKPIGVLGSARATNEENYLAARLSRAGLGTQPVDFCYRSVCGPMLAGIEDVTGDSFPAVRLTDIESSDTILLVEGDLAKTHPRAASLVLTAIAKGSRLIAIGCVETQMARVSSCFLQTPPGREGDAIGGLLATVLRDGPIPGSEAAERFAGIEQVRRELAGRVATEEMRTAAGWLRADRAFFLMGPGSGRAAQLRRDAAAMASLAAVTGHLGKPGSGLLPLLARSNVRGAWEMRLAPVLPSGRGLDAASMLASVAGLIVLADDPAAVLPAGHLARAAMERLDFVVVLDAFMTPAAKLAHAVLPIASYAETDGTCTNMEGRVQRVRRTTAPPGDARDGWRVLAELCARFGTGGAWRSAAEVFHEITKAVPRYAAAEAELRDGEWGSAFVEEPASNRFVFESAVAEKPAQADGPYMLALDGTFDWGADPSVAFSPILSREYRSARKLFPNGLVEMNNQDADALGVREGWRVKVNSAHAEAVVPIRLRKDLPRGVLLAPYAFRDCLSGVLHGVETAAVNVERA